MSQPDHFEKLLLTLPENVTFCMMTRAPIVLGGEWYVHLRYGRPQKGWTQEHGLPNEFMGKADRPTTALIDGLVKVEEYKNKLGITNE